MTTTQQDLTTMEPSEIDGILFPLWAERYRQVQHRMGYAAIIDSESKRTERLLERNPDYVHPYEARIAEINARLAEIAEAIAPLNAEYKRRGGWTRFDFVPDGHLHHYGCHTLRPTTERLLVAEASGQTDEWIVEHFAYAACTYCFPEAPVEARETYLREQKEARAAVKAEKAAAKAAKDAEKNLVEQIVIGGDADGRWAEKIHTIYAAKQWLKSYVEWNVWRPGEGHVSYPEAGAATVREALALKGIDTAPLEAKWAKAAAK